MGNCTKHGPAGLDGLLIFVIAALVISVARTNELLFTQGLALFTSGAWSALTTPGGAAYSPRWPLLLLDLAGQLTVVALAVLTLIHLLQRSRRTPRLAIAWAALSVLALVVDFCAGRGIPLLSTLAARSLTDDAGHTLAGAVLWIPYFLISRRVKATFVH